MHYRGRQQIRRIKQFCGSARFVFNRALTW
ncbi:helix-turn-helix domain-containing protein [Glaesserella parasuis]|uniref:Helix-turn-helix domain-containing protein n=1 Tax=Glaesserella parasuis TaxID=738 RepID=A0AA42EDB4_GLAPU|nr:helix-turn-helix domain-containing protein [Glaesserella parasuis]MDD2167456.1 helix-turn-helix domain-containing protein [Glaesserella parasuis]MDG6231282.1 helix-turn-helix domain-containing protein [Glaesserella parasuis]MDG6345921.1 helix-turn-helix domain-containing protein [Glaesserella parasuis]MDO9767276.1 helix-turn-helix domain-containing protein [Glaesserella parasuis]MDO9873676.1 helix-turn-helix domain-containing protein [Glaesserella parasuis]